MNSKILNKIIKNQADRRVVYKNGFICLIVFSFSIICFLSVLYVNAAESSGEEKGTVETMSGTSYAASNFHEKQYIRMANEDAIPVAQMMLSGINLSAKDYAILTRIVEAEATGLNKKSKILVANVILNRMKDEEFPDTVEGVVFQKVNGAVQFSPVADGRYYSVAITESTKECVNRALAGEDYSEGALYFMERSMADPDNVRWFDTALTKLFVYEGHEFYR